MPAQNPHARCVLCGEDEPVAVDRFDGTAGALDLCANCQLRLAVRLAKAQPTGYLRNLVDELQDELARRTEQEA